MKPPFLPLLALALLTLSVGCKKEIMITGTVKYSDGEAMTHGSVVFDSGTDSYFGRIDKSGNYTTGGEKEKQGIPPGSYKIWISGTKIEIGADPTSKGESRGEIKETVAEIFTSPSETPLSFEVKADGPKTFDITIERP